MSRQIPLDWRKMAGLAIASLLALNPFAFSQGGELPGGVRFFSSPPRLVDSATTFNAVSIPAAKYYFTISLPENAGEPLSSIVFHQQANPDPINFHPDQTVAFFGDRRNRGEKILLESVDWYRDTGKITVIFGEAISPGQTITIALKPWKNPDVPGVYQFRVFALPPGANPQAMDLGLGRFQFYRGGTW